jgi:hypothetical protein
MKEKYKNKKKSFGSLVVKKYVWQPCSEKYDWQSCSEKIPLFLF